MEPFVKNFIRASLVWLGLGVSLGVAMVVVPQHALVYRPAHMHANLLGFVSMMIFGVAYHVLPRFAGHPLRSRRAAALHLWAANVGLASMAAGWLTRPWAYDVGTLLLIAGGLASAGGAFLFIGNIWQTLAAPAGAGAPVQLARRV